MMKQQSIRSIHMTKWICLALCALLCAALLGVPARGAKAANETISAPGATVRFGDVFTLTCTPDGAAGTVTSYEWSATGAVTKNDSTTDSCVFTATDVGDATVDCTVHYESGASSSATQQTFTVDKATRTISVASVPTGNKLYASATAYDHALSYSLSNTEAGDATPTWSSGTPAGLTFNSTTGTISVPGNTTAGSIDNITVSVVASTHYEAATSAGVAVTLEAAPRTVTISGLPGGTHYASATDLVLSLNDPTNGGGAISWTTPTITGSNITTSVDSGNRLHIVTAEGAAGTVSGIGATIAANGNYASATTATASVTVDLAKPTVTMPANFSVGVGATGTSIGATSSSNGTKTFTSSAPGVVYIDDPATGEYRALTKGSATITFTQAQAGYHAAIVPGDNKTVTVTVGDPALAFNPDSVTITADKGTASVVASVINTTTGLAPVILSGYDGNVIQVNSTSSANGTNTFTITARAKGTTNITATTTVNGATLTKTLPVTVNYANASYFTIDSWYHYLNYDRRYTEITAVLHNPGNGVPTNARTYWVMSNNVSKVLWTNEYMQYDAGSNTYYTRIRVKAMRNGTTTAYMNATGDVGASYEFHVNSMSYIPQSGQDSTAIYLVGALLLASAAATVAVYAYRRKRSRS